MQLFLDILVDITLPIIVLAALGFGLQRRLSLDIDSLNRLMLYVFLPGFLIHYLSSSPVPLAEVGVTAWFTLVQFFVLLALGWLAAAVWRRSEGIRPVVALAAAFPNSGNYAIPLVALAFGPEYVLHQAVIVSLHSVLISSVGVLMLSAGGTRSIGHALAAAFRTPMLAAVLIGLTLKAFDVRLPEPVSVPLAMMGEGFTPLALFTLGAQLASASVRGGLGPLGLGLVLRLAAAPFLTWVAVRALGIAPPLGDLLVVTAATPVGILLAIFCREYDAREDLAAAFVFISTALSPLVITLVIYLLRL